MLSTEDVRDLACPISSCRGRLEFVGDPEMGRLRSGRLHCPRCVRGWPIRTGVAHLIDEPALRLSDRLGRVVYDLYAPLHDAAVDYLLPVLQLEGATRESYVGRLELDALRSKTKTAPLRILEIGIGGGANLPLIERHLGERGAEIWGVDISRAMIEKCAERANADHPHLDVRLLLADAHALPFPDASFDRVFHVGAIASYGNPALGLAEMARVARPGTPIVVVDEQLDPGRLHFPHQYAMFWLTRLTGAETNAPVTHLPEEACNVRVEQVSRFYYCLTFRMPSGTSKRPLGRKRNGRQMNGNGVRR